MQSPIIVFDHLKKSVATIQPGPAYEQKIVEVAASQANQSTSAGQNPSRP